MCLHKNLYIVALFIIANCLSTDEWINKVCYIYTMKHSAIKGNIVLIYAIAWMNLKKLVDSKKLDTKGHILYDSTWQVHRDRE